jgi:hypothetical protein
VVAKQLKRSASTNRFSSWQMLATRPILIAGTMDPKSEPPEPFLSSPGRLAQYTSGVNLMAFRGSFPQYSAHSVKEVEREVFKTGPHPRPSPVSLWFHLSYPSSAYNCKLRGSRFCIATFDNIALTFQLTTMMMATLITSRSQLLVTWLPALFLQVALAVPQDSRTGCVSYSACQ